MADRCSREADHPVSSEPSGRPYLSLVIPAYNEARRLEVSLPGVVAYLRRTELDAELLVVDDGSTDDTIRVARELLRDTRHRVLTHGENRGKGFSVRQGVLEAHGRWVLMTDADLSTPIEEYETLASAARDNDADVVIGSRALPDSKVEVRQNPLRQAMGKTFSILMRTMTGLPFRDTQCGFKLMDRKRVEPIFRKMVVDRFAFDVELLYLSHRFGLRTLEVPVIWRNVEASRVNMLADSLNMLLDVGRIRWRFRQGAYNPDSSV